MRLKDRVCIITGAASGIGKDAVELFMEEGAIVIGVDRSEQALVSLNEEKSGFSFHPKCIDISNPDQAQTMVHEVIQQHQKIDVLINNAGIIQDALLHKMTMQQWNDVININLTGTFIMTKAVAPYMLEAGSGSIINTSSVVGLWGNVGQSNYAASKAGVIALSKTWAKELTRKGSQIRVNAVCPGFTMTPILETVPEKILESMKEKTLLKRIASPHEVARVYLFLCSDDASYITGQTISVDGGLSL